jgi:hypothetical protein
LYIRRNARCEGEEKRVEPGLALNEKRHDPAAAGATESGWPVRKFGIGRTLTAVFAALAMTGTPAAAAHAAQQASVRAWWLDLETANNWQSSTRNNRADLEGTASYFRHIGAKVGIYSTASQWNPIVGTVPPSSPLYRLPDWRPGAKTLAQAKKNCHLAR